jgi:ankyrin repeat protein
MKKPIIALIVIASSTATVSSQTSSVQGQNLPNECATLLNDYNLKTIVCGLHANSHAFKHSLMADFNISLEKIKHDTQNLLAQQNPINRDQATPILREITKARNNAKNLSFLTDIERQQVIDTLDAEQRELEERLIGSPDQQLQEAVRTNNTVLATKLLRQGVNANTADPNGYTPLHYAIFGNNLETVKLLVQYKANLNYADKQGVTPLIVAASNGYTNIVRLLLEHNADVDIIAKSNGQNALIVAALKGHLETVRVLLEHGANSNHADTSGRTARICAAWKGHTDVVRLLTKHYQAMSHHDFRPYKDEL